MAKVCRAILSRSTQEVTLVALFVQCANHRVTPQVIMGLFRLALEWPPSIV